MLQLFGNDYPFPAVTMRLSEMLLEIAGYSSMVLPRFVTTIYNPC